MQCCHQDALAMVILAEMIVFSGAGFAAKENKGVVLRSGLKYISVHCYSITSYTIISAALPLTLRGPTSTILNLSFTSL